MKPICLVPASWDAEECARHTCQDRSHIHISRRKLWELQCDDLVEWIKEPLYRRDRGIARLRRVRVAMRGLSCRIGAELAVAVLAGEAWARAMLDQIQLRPARDVLEVAETGLPGQPTD